MEEAPSYGSSHIGLKKLVWTSPTAQVSLLRSQAGALQSECQTKSWGKMGVGRKVWGEMATEQACYSYPMQMTEVVGAATGADKYSEPPTSALSSKDN